MRDDGFAWRLRRVIYASGLSQTEFANLVGLSRTAIGDYLSGTTEPKWSTLRRIMLKTGCSARDLLGGREQ